MHSVGKMTSLSEEDLFDDHTNINAMEAKCEVVSALFKVCCLQSSILSKVPEEVLCLLRDFKTKSNGTDEKSALLQ